MTTSARKPAIPPAVDADLIAEILVLLEKLSNRFEPDDDEMKRWIGARFNNPVLIELLRDSTIMMLRVLDAIGRLEPVNGAGISKQYGIPRGSVSKATRRLAARKLIVTESLPNNKKEILFRTTPLGRELYEAHRAFDDHMGKGFMRFLERYDADELAFIIRVLKEVNEVSFLELAARGSEREE